MRYLHLNGRKTPVSQIALGSTYFGTAIAETTAWNMLDHFVALGGTTIDTARHYGQRISTDPSPSEQLIGSWLKINGMHQHMVLIGKGLYPEPTGKSRFSYANLLYDIERSMDELHTDTFDIWFFHRDDPRIPVDEIMDMVAPLVQSGVIQTLGASNWTVQRIAAANAYAEAHHLPQIQASEIQWSLAKSTPESWQDPTLVCMTEEELSWYQSHEMAVFAFSSQAKGFFSKAIAKEPLNTKSQQRFGFPENYGRIERVAQLSEELNCSPAAITVSYITSQKPDSVAIIGPSSISQLEDSLTDSNLVLSNEQIAFLEGRI
jgi:aryl-alcohol dehydrogenase-like predicted oxidoreductase